jgi:hypothetical protein
VYLCQIGGCEIAQIKIKISALVGIAIMTVPISTLVTISDHHAIAFDRCIQKTHSPTTTLARTQFQAPLNLGEAAVLRAEPAGLWDTGPWSNYAFSQPSPVDDAKPSVTRQTSTSTSPEIDTSLLNDFYEFIKAREPGAYSVLGATFSNRYHFGT